VSLGTPSSLGTGSSTSSPTATIAGVSCAAGDLVVVAVAVTGADGEGFVYCVDSVVIGGESLTQAVIRNWDNSSAALWYLVATGAHVSATITAEVSLGTPLAIALAASKTSGAAAVPLDKTSFARSTSGTPNCGATGTRSQAAEVIFAAVGTRGPEADTPGTWNDVAAFQRVGAGAGTNGATVDVGQAIVANTTDLTADKSGMTSREWCGVCATFKESLAQSSTPASVGALAVVCAASIIIGAVVSACSSISIPTTVNPAVGVPGGRTVLGSSVGMIASVSTGSGAVVFSEVSARAPQVVTPQAVRESGTSVIKTLRAVDTRIHADGYLGDGDLNTYRSHLKVGPFTGGFDFYADCTGVSVLGLAGSGVISGVILHAYCRFTAELGGGETLTLSAPVFVLPGRSVAMTTPPIGDWGTGTPLDCKSALVTTTDGSTLWTWGNIFAALTNLKVQVHAVYDGFGTPCTFDVGELWVEVMGPVGSKPSVLRGRDFMGRIRGRDVMDTEVGGD
jgi:hypothetical protein